MRRAFKFRAYLSQETEKNASHWLFLCRQLYNACLEQRIDAYQRCGKSLSDYTQQLELKTLKMDFPEYKEVGSQVLKEVVRDLDKAYKAFFRRAKAGVGKSAGFPKFKGRDFYNSFRFPNSSGWKFDGKILDIKYVGRLKLKGGRPITGEIKTVCVKRERTWKWFVVFSCDQVPSNPQESTGRTTGIDVGITRFATDAQGNIIENPRIWDEHERKMRILQRKLSRQKPGSKRREQTRIQIARLHDHIVNCREDFANKLAHQYAMKHDIIAAEKLSIKKMAVKTAETTSVNLRRNIHDVAWRRFRENLKNQCEDHSRTLIEIDPAYTTMTCHLCGHVQEMKLSDRVFKCLGCGRETDRTYNSATNIHRRGLEAIRADRCNGGI